MGLGKMLELEDWNWTVGIAICKVRIGWNLHLETIIRFQHLLRNNSVKFGIEFGN